MSYQRGSWAPALLLLALVGCENPDPLAPSFMVVNPPASLAASAVAFNQITLVWQDNSSNETGFEVHRSTTGPTGSFSLLVTAGAGATSYNDFGVAGTTQYCYKIRTLRVTGRKNNYSAFSNVACATTPRPPVPLAASGVTAVPITGYFISIGWTDNSTNESGFRVERAPSASGQWSSIGSLSMNATGLNDFYPPLDQNLCYRVFAINSYGDADPSNVACTAMPAAPSNLAVSSSSSGQDLTWTDNSAVEDGFNVWRSQGSDSSLVAHLAANASGYHDAASLIDGTYAYSVEATRDGGTSGRSNVVQVVVATVPPLAPAGADAFPSSSNVVVLYWNDGSTNEQGFRIERSSDGGASWVVAGNTGVNENGFFDYGLPSEQQVCYRVVAFNGIGDSPASNADCTIPPAGPTDLVANALDDYTVDLSWTDNSAVEEGYEIWADDGYGPFEIGSVGRDITTFQVTGYYAYCCTFAVIAPSDGGYSDWSSWVTASPPPGSASVRSGAMSRLRAPSPPSLHVLPGKARGKP